mgnify:CR=1 FL=1|jgi:hypothetical protein
MGRGNSRGGGGGSGAYPWCARGRRIEEHRGRLAEAARGAGAPPACWQAIPRTTPSPPRPVLYFAASVARPVLYFAASADGVPSLARRRAQAAGGRGARAHPSSPRAQCPICLDDIAPLRVAAAALADRLSRPSPAEEAGQPVAPAAGDGGSGGGSGDGGDGGGDGNAPAVAGCAEEGSAPGEGVTPGGRVLECGHRFCEPCIGGWLSRSDNCPICRAAVRSAGAAAPPAPPMGGEFGLPHEAQPGGRPAGGRSALAAPDDTHFRLSSLRNRYPLAVSDSMVRALAGPRERAGG